MKRHSHHMLLLASAFVSTSNSSFTSPARTNLSKNNASRLNSSSSKNNIFKRISNTVESSLATVQSVLFFGRMPPGLPQGMHPVPTQFIAALGDPKSTSGTSGAEQWGIWRIDPGPRGVYVKDFQLNQSLGTDNKKMPAGWKYDANEFWIEEFGRVMEPPDFPLTPGRYLVTGAREAITLLTVDPPNEKGEQGWKLDGDVSLYDVTHLPCRSARYFPKQGETPADANWSDFPVTPGGAMPAVKGCSHQDYAVLFVLAVDD